MSDTYQAVYDAARSRMSNGDIGNAVEQALRDANISHYAAAVAESIQQAVAGYTEPSVVYRPSLYIDGNQWCALYGENLQKGVAGFGLSPALAIADFNVKWYTELKVKI
jgi:hypothetical protein